ncbi:tetratricopeptide repeat protein [Telmatospirillum siberiense]|uniref:Uncharacterized protein n=1 Tax=Telmatospirillum siberiense TaxID=382514 RepID=A0A2N3PZZ7_9PROT|nr:tetratricopeptide repeat protein [Telmatospirillum siberiense]PKU25969.1 hypothetical protein CWS72_02165 [Telmatospirillum siberiense]
MPMDYSDLLLAQAIENEKAGDWTGAELFYRGLLKENPTHPEANLHLGRLLVRRGSAEEGTVFLERAADAAPSSPEPHMHLGSAYQALGQPDRAMLALVIATNLQGVMIHPDDVQAWFQLGVTFSQADRHQAAAAAFRHALVLQPAFAEIHNNLGISLQNLQLAAEAVQAHRRAVAAAPHVAGHHANHAHALLAAGHLAEGFAEWEWRPLSPPRSFSQPRWDGKPFEGRTLLAHAEQGYGDVIQFCRYLPEAARRGGRLIVECRAPLAGLIKRMPGVADVIEWGSPLPDFDFEIPIPSLPFAFGVDSDVLAAAPGDPYLHAVPDREARWRKALSRDDDKLKVGLIWAGNAAGLDPKRAIPPNLLSGLTLVPGVALYSLQREGGDTIRRTDGGQSVTDLGGGIADFDDLAAILTGLDLLISVDTAAAHLAGAMGRPVWTLLHASPDWRWLPGPDRTAWYPSMRLYRQNRPGDWREVITRVADDLNSQA